MNTNKATTRKLIWTFWAFEQNLSRVSWKPSSQIHRLLMHDECAITQFSSDSHIPLSRTDDQHLWKKLNDISNVTSSSFVDESLIILTALISWWSFWHTHVPFVLSQIAFGIDEHCMSCWHDWYSDVASGRHNWSFSWLGTCVDLHWHVPDIQWEFSTTHSSSEKHCSFKLISRRHLDLFKFGWCLLKHRHWPCWHVVLSTTQLLVSRQYSPIPVYAYLWEWEWKCSH